VPRRSMKASTEIAAADREAKAVEMRAAGHNFQAIADTLGYSDASGASKAYHRALRRRPAQNVDQVRQQEAERIEYLWQRTAAVIEDPGPRVSAIGKLAVYPAGHPRAGEIVADESVRLRAAHEYRMQSESYRKLCGADIVVKDANPEEEQQLAEAMTWVRELTARNKTLEVENLALRTQVAQWENGQLQRAQIAA
jgi:hypothetical protein